MELLFRLNSSKLTKEGLKLSGIKNKGKKSLSITVRPTISKIASLSKEMKQSMLEVQRGIALIAFKFDEESKVIKEELETLNEIPPDRFRK